MKKNLLLLATIILMVGNLYSQTWNYATSTGTSFILYGMSFPPNQNDIGYACGMEYTYNADGVVVKTTDGGNNWTQVLPTSGDIDGLQGIWFISDLVGFAGGWNNYFIKTTDGGNNWTPVSCGTNVWYYVDVEFWDSNNGIAAARMNGSEQAVFITSDGGNTWVPATSGISTGGLMGVSYADQNTIFAVGTDAKVYKSTDGGHNWITQYTLPAMLFGVDFADANFGVVGAEEKMFATTDGGSTWTTHTTGYENFYACEAYTDGTAYIGGTDENIYSTSDFGATWTMHHNGGGTSHLYRIRTTDNGNMYACGSQGTILINEMPFGADFTADATTVCEGDVVNFTDLSTGTIVSWNWTFEGGTPATSTDQNPSVTYNTAGVYDVTLEVSDGTNTDTYSVTDMITVNLPAPPQPNTPSGPIDVCAADEVIYTTFSVANANTYYWEVSPSDAGTIENGDTSALFTQSATWTGAYTVKVQASSDCGYGPWSSELSCNLYFTPAPYNVSQGGGYCEGSNGIEVILDGSEVDVDYELFLDDVSTGTILAGTGSALSFGFQTDEGIYSVTGYATMCNTDMYGGSYIYLLNLPAAASQPSGSDMVCAGTTTDYQTDAVAEADTLIWVLDPADAGIIIGDGENISVQWSSTFKGMAYLSVYGSNDCGDGTVSPTLDITVDEAPQPVVNGKDLVCEGHTEDYFTTDNTGATYTWEVIGGSISNGAGTAEISIDWTNVGSGYVLVNEMSANGCEAVSDTLFVTIDDCTGLDPVTNFDQITVYPNPAKNNLNIAFMAASQMDYTISIYNHMGQQVYKATYQSQGGKEQKQINIETLPAGMYFVKMHNASSFFYQGKIEKFN